MKTLTIENYQKLAKRTCPDLGDNEKNLLHMRLGIITEVGEVLDIFKKNLAYGKPIDIVNLGEELADIAWYLVNEATFRNKELSKIPSFSNTGITYIEALMYLDVNLQDETMDYDNALGLLDSVSTQYGIDFYNCLYKNIEKLQIRYPNKFDADLALNRNLDAERKVLEGEKPIFLWKKKFGDVHIQSKNETLCGIPMLGNNYSDSKEDVVNCTKCLESLSKQK